MCWVISFLFQECDYNWFFTKNFASTNCLFEISVKGFFFGRGIFKQALCGKDYYFRRILRLVIFSSLHPPTGQPTAIVGSYSSSKTFIQHEKCWSVTVTVWEMRCIFFLFHILFTFMTDTSTVIRILKSFVFTFCMNETIFNLYRKFA